MKLTGLDKEILNRLQTNIPFVKRPWKSVAKELGIEEATLLERIDSLKKKGIIRRISATFNPRKVGFVSTLIAIKVASGNIDKVIKKLNTYDEVTHNYKRNSGFNIWFTLVARSGKKITQIINKLEKDKDIEAVLNLPAVRLFKIGVRFKL